MTQNEEGKEHVSGSGCVETTRNVLINMKIMMS